MLQIKLLPIFFTFCFFLVFSGCNSGSETITEKIRKNEQAQTAEVASWPAANYELLFIGNSHSSANGLPELVAKLITSAQQDKTVNTGLAPNFSFLDERINDGVTLELINARKWTHVFLQAQKYSTSGMYSYSTDAAQFFIKSVKAQDAMPIMFPEWPRYNNKEEGERVYQLHQQIAAQEPACVAPVGPAWDTALESHANIKLHAKDGNHSSLNGALFTAYLFFQIITTEPANVLAYIPDINVSESTQAKLKAVAVDFHNVHLPCP